MRPADVGIIFAQAFSEYSSRYPHNNYLKTVDIVIYEKAHLEPFCSGFTTSGAGKFSLSYICYVVKTGWVIFSMVSCKEVNYFLSFSSENGLNSFKMCI